MVRTITFVGTDDTALTAVNQAEDWANTYLREHLISRQQIISTHTTLSQVLAEGVVSHTFTITIVLEIP